MTYPTFHRSIQIDGLPIFFGEAGPKDGPALLLCCTDFGLRREWLSHFSPAVRSLSPGRARLPRLRSQRLAGPENIRVYVRPLRRDHESLHRNSRELALHTLHAGFWRPCTVSDGLASSRSHRSVLKQARQSALDWIEELELMARKRWRVGQPVPLLSRASIDTTVK